MDTVSKLSEYAKSKGIDKQIIGIPKTIDNDLVYTDHTPQAMEVQQNILQQLHWKPIWIRGYIQIMEYLY